MCGGEGEVLFLSLLVEFVSWIDVTCLLHHLQHVFLRQLWGERDEFLPVSPPPPPLAQSLGRDDGNDYDSKCDDDNTHSNEEEGEDIDKIVLAVLLARLLWSGIKVYSIFYMDGVPSVVWGVYVCGVV